MKRGLLLSFVFLLLTAGSGFSQDTLSRDERMKWWREARFGMFIHWGDYAVLAGTYKDHRIAHGGEWVMNRAKIPVMEYRQYAKQFDPVKYDPDAWVRMAKDAGMKYIVITAKHHDGFAMFKSNASKWNIVDATPYGKDVLKPLAAACRKYGIRLGFYYSQAQDWNNPGGAVSRKTATDGWANPDSARIDAYTTAHEGHWDPYQTTRTMAQYIDDVAVPQVRELLTNYGKVAVLWWDTPTHMTDEFAEKLQSLLKLQPGIITNDRLKRPDFPGDFMTPEQHIPESAVEGKDFEVCMTMNGTWGYKSDDDKWKSVKTLVRNLLDIASKGGNYLLNVGPEADGTFPQESIDILKGMGAWMKVNGGAVYATQKSPLPALSWGRCTSKEQNGHTILYLSVFEWPATGKLKVPGMQSSVVSAKLLATGQALATTAGGDGLSVDLPAVMPDTIATVIRLELAGQQAERSSSAVLTPPPPQTPRINGAKVFGVRPGHPLFFTIPATGIRPMSFSAQHLPKGLKIDKNTGRLSGSIAKPGEYTVTLTAKNRLGKTSENFKIVAGENIALTPPMGWNSWNIYGTKVTQELVLANAEAMAASGLINHGWTYMNIDDAWQGSRGGPYHAIQGDPGTFSDIGGLADRVHRLGLKIGIYSSPWVETYGHHAGESAENPEGSFEKTKENIPRNKKILPYAIGRYNFVSNDVKQWARWKIDYLKYDWNPAELPETKLMYDALRASGRDVVFSLSNSIPFASIAELRPVANSWRTGGDIRDNWKSLKSRLFTQDKWAPYAGPGHWNDPDMMIVGYVGWGKDEHPTQLTPDEQYTHMSAWCLMSVPLLLGCDLTKLDPFTLGLLTNDEVLALDQDPLGKQATVVARDGENGILAKELSGGSLAAGLFNTGDEGPQQITLKWEDLKISGPYIVRDLWRQKDLGTFTGSFTATVAQHGVVLVGLRKAR